jgi:hypothetical protein
LLHTSRSDCVPPDALRGLACVPPAQLSGEGSAPLQAPALAAPVAIGPVLLALADGRSGTVVATVVAPLCAYPTYDKLLILLALPRGLDPLFSPCEGEKGVVRILLNLPVY